MSMQLRVVHTATFEYDGSAVASHNQARLTPVTSPEQIVVHSRLEVSPKPWVFEYRDYFGTAVSAFEVVDPHERMTVTSTSTVQTNRAHGPAAATAALSWADLAEREVADRWTEYLFTTELVAPPSDLAQRARQVAADHERPGAAARDLCALVHDEVEVVVGPSEPRPAGEAWRQRSGSCADVVHLTIGAQRTIGVPARYVSGYAHPEGDPAVGATVAGSAHGWVEWWDDAWRAFDPCRDTEPDDRYVVLATGRDLRDVRPLSGIFSGSGTSRLDVDVEITRLA